MAQSITQFSFLVPVKDPQVAQAEAEAVIESLQADDGYGFGIGVNIDGESLWFAHDGQDAQIEEVADVVREIIARGFAVTDEVHFTFAVTCQRPMLDAFYGGAVVVTAQDTFFQTSLDADPAGRETIWRLTRADVLRLIGEFYEGEDEVDSPSADEIEAILAGLPKAVDHSSVPQALGEVISAVVLGP